MRIKPIDLNTSHKKDVKISLKRDFSKVAQDAKLRVICGPMFSGKTKTLISVIKSYAAADKEVFVFKPKLDDRYAEDEVVSHDKDSFKALNIKKPIEILDYYLNADVIAIDEVQFFDESIVDVCQKIAQSGKEVIVSGLDLDYKAQPFGSMPKILAVADEIIKLNSVCTFCSGHARFSHRISTESDIVVLGEKDKYVPLCRSCYYELSDV